VIRLLLTVVLAFGQVMVSVDYAELPRDMIACLNGPGKPALQRVQISLCGPIEGFNWNGRSLTVTQRRGDPWLQVAILRCGRFDSDFDDDVDLRDFAAWQAGNRHRG